MMGNNLGEISAKASLHKYLVRLLGPEYPDFYRWLQTGENPMHDDF